MEKLFFEGNELSITHPDLCKEWDYDKNFPLTPDMITAGSNKKVWWKCYVCGNEWQAVIKDRIRGTGCPKCSRKK